MDINTQRLGYLDDVYGARIQTLFSNPSSVAQAVSHADLVVGAVLVAGARAPHLVTEDMVKAMKPGSVIVDVSIDQGGCIATARPTTHQNPTFVEHGVVHYCVTNMPGAVPRTSTFALTNVTLKYGLALADLGLQGALERYAELRPGVNTLGGICRNARVGESLKLPCQPVEF
jgi:alanine dehydrogenase